MCSATSTTRSAGKPPFQRAVEKDARPSLHPAEFAPWGWRQAEKESPSREPLAVICSVVAVLLLSGFFVALTLVGVAVVGVVVVEMSPGTSTSLCGTSTTEVTVAPLLAGVDWGTVIET